MYSEYFFTAFAIFSQILVLGFVYWKCVPIIHDMITYFIVIPIRGYEECVLYFFGHGEKKPISIRQIVRFYRYTREYEPSEGDMHNYLVRRELEYLKQNS